MENNFEVIKCKHGIAFSFCNIDYSNDVDWLLQKAYYVTQGCTVGFSEVANLQHNCIKDATLLHNHDEFEEEVKKIIEDKYVNDPKF